MTKLFKALGATLLALGLVVAGAAIPANAGQLTSPSVTATGTIGTTGTNAYPITIAASTVSAAAQFNVTLPTGWTANFPGGPNCNGITYTGIVIAGMGCTTNVAGVVRFYGTNGSGQALDIPAGTALTITFPAGKLNTAAGRDFTLSSVTSGTALDSSVVTLGSSASATVTFDANGGSGSMSAQTSSSAITLTPNAFTRTNYNFAGWNTAADGSGTAYADAASFPFTSSATLYAQWTPTLANTGMSDVTWQMGEITLALMGFGILLYIRQRKRNA